MLVRVKAKHIRKGVRYRSCLCAIALAVKDTLAQDLTGLGVSVLDKVLIHRISDGQLVKIFEMSSPAVDFMRKFDNGPKSAVKTATFRLQEVKL